MSNHYNNYRSEQREIEETVHWRKIKAIGKMTVAFELNESVSDYDFDHIACYVSRGLQLQGSNVRYINTVMGQSPINFNEHYVCFEIKKKGTSQNIGKYSYLTGQFLLVAYDRTADYWMICKMTYYLDNHAKSHVSYEPVGYYTVTASDDDRITMNSFRTGNTCVYGGFGCRRYEYDDSIRARGYHVYWGDVQLSITNSGAHRVQVCGGRKVPVYKKKSKKKYKNRKY